MRVRPATSRTKTCGLLLPRHSCTVASILCVVMVHMEIQAFPAMNCPMHVCPGALATCRRLRRLDLARNRVEDVNALRSLTSLTLLGLEDNRLASVHGAHAPGPATAVLPFAHCLGAQCSGALACFMPPARAWTGWPRGSEFRV